MVRTTVKTPDPEKGGEGTEKRRTANPLGLVPLSHFKPASQQYLWEGLIPLGQLTLVGGAGGAYKSTVITHVLAKLTVGELEGDFLGTPINVMYLTKENDPRRSMQPKIRAASGDAKRFFILGSQRGLKFPEDTGRLIAHVEATETRVIVMDPLIAFLNQKRSLQGNYGYAVEILNDLMDECTRRDVTVIGISHLTKGKKKAETDSMVGSVGLTTTARQVLMVGKISDDLSIVASTKANDGPTFNGWAFSVEHRPIGRDTKTKRIIHGPHVELVRPCTKTEAKAMFADTSDITIDARSHALLVFINDTGTTTTKQAERFLCSKFNIRERQARTTIGQAVTSNLLTREVDGSGGNLVYKLSVSTAGQRLLEESDDLPDPDGDENFEEFQEPDGEEGFESFDA